LSGGTILKKFIPKEEKIWKQINDKTLRPNSEQLTKFDTAVTFFQELMEKYQDGDLQGTHFDSKYKTATVTLKMHALILSGEEEIEEFCSIMHDASAFQVEADTGRRMVTIGATIPGVLVRDKKKN
jgi:uncharacterized lipoprotein YehR (DUF1307 family)